MPWAMATHDTTPQTLADVPREIALPRLVAAQGGRLYQIGLRFCGSPEEAEDLVQETFLQAFRKWHQFEGRSDPATWLYSIAVRICQRRHRRRAGEPAHIASLSELLPAASAGVPDLPSPDAGPLEARLRSEAREVVEAAIARLPTPFRLALVLKDIAELSVDEVAQVLGLKPATVKTRVHRARLQLRRDLSETLSQRAAPPPDHAQRVCLDLLHAKQQALDRGVPFPVPQEELCTRCAALFATLDLAQGACHEMGQGPLPTPVRQALMAEFEGGGSSRREVSR